VSTHPPKPAWFELKKYGRARTLDFRQWATQIGNRIHLAALLEAGMSDEFDRHFERIQTNPLDDLGFSGSRASDKTFYPLSFGEVKTITTVLSETDCGDKDFCDEKLRELHPDIFSSQAHLYVNLRASKTLLKQQFSDWLDQSLLKRKRAAPISTDVTRTWAVTHPILPYQDLSLWLTRQCKTLPSDFVMADWLELREGDKNTARDIRIKAQYAFTLECYFDLKFSASNSAVTDKPQLPHIPD
jgi:Family of unknown function (DUF6387)